MVLPHGRSHHADSGQNLLGKSDEQTTEYAEDALGALGGVGETGWTYQLDDAPRPSTITPTALMHEKMKSLRLLTMVRGSVSAARAGQARAAHRVSMRDGGEIEAVAPSGPPLRKGIRLGVFLVQHENQPFLFQNFDVVQTLKRHGQVGPGRSQSGVVNVGRCPAVSVSLI